MDEQGDVVPVASEPEEPSVNVSSGDDTLMEDLSGDGDEEGGEIMVEVVGSDVFVDGVSSHSDEGLDVGGDNVWDGGVEESGTIEGFHGESKEGDLTERVHGVEVGPVLSSEKQHVSEQVEMVGDLEAVGKHGDAGDLDDEVQNRSGTEGTSASAVMEESLRGQSQAAVEEAVMMGHEEDCEVPSGEFVRIPDAAVEGEIGVANNEEGLNAASETIRTKECDEISGDCEKREDCAAGETVLRDEKPVVSPRNPIEEASSHGGSDVAAVGSVSSKAGVGDIVINGESASGAERAQIVSIDSLVVNNACMSVHSPSQVSSDDEHLATESGVKEVDDRPGSLEHQEFQITTAVGTMKADIDHKEVPAVDVMHSTSDREAPISDIGDVNFGCPQNSEHLKQRMLVEGADAVPPASEPSKEPLCQGESGKNDEVRDIKGKAETAMNCSEASEHSQAKGKCESLENDMAQEFLVSTGETAMIAGAGDGVAKDKFEVGADTVDKPAVITNVEFSSSDPIGLGLSVDAGLAQSDLRLPGHILIAKEETEVMEDNKFSSSQEVVLEGKTASFHGSTSVSSEFEDFKMETVAEYDTSGNNPAQKAELGVQNTCPAEIDSAFNEKKPGKDMHQEVVAQPFESMAHEYDQHQTESPLILDKMSEEGSYAAVVSDVAYETQNAGDPAWFQSEDAPGILFDDGNRINDASPINNNVIPLHGGETIKTDMADVEISDQVLISSSGVEDMSDDMGGNGINFSQAPEVRYTDAQEEDDIEVGCKEQETGTGGLSYATNLSESDDMAFKPVSSLNIHQPAYLLPPEKEGEFCVSDLVWGKVRSHPWWPGQIFDPADASDKAVKYYRKDCFLVGYFGDRTFAWNEATLLKPFRSHFSQVEKQSNSEAFQNAVSCALDEVSRRVELGLICSCVPKEAYERIASQVVENTGIRPESSRRYGVDESSGVTAFEPDKLCEYLRALACSPSFGADRLDLAIARAQLSSFCRFKAYRQPPEFLSFDVSFEDDGGMSNFNDDIDLFDPLSEDGEQDVAVSSHKRKPSLVDGFQPRKKERSLTDLMDDAPYSPDDEDGKAPGKSLSSIGRKRKAVDPMPDGSDRRVSIYAAKVSTAASPPPKPSFKIGECIRRVASQLTGSITPSGENSHQGGENSPRGPTIASAEFPSPQEMLSQLQSAAQDPRGYSFSIVTISFFTGFRNSIALSRNSEHAGKLGGSRKKRGSQSIGGVTEEFEFDDAIDSYWTDRIVQNYTGEQLLQNGENGGEIQLVVYEQDKSKPGRRSRKQYSTGNYEMAAKEQAEFERRKREVSPAELVMIFAEGNSVPSETNLTRMFRRFGPLKESETEVDQESARAKVVFKRGSDAEVAYSSAGKFNIFGSKLVNYQLSYTPSTTFRSSSFPILQAHAGAT